MGFAVSFGEGNFQPIHVEKSQVFPPVQNWSRVTTDPWDDCIYIYTLGIQSYSQMMIGVYNHLLSKAITILRR